MAQRQYNAEDVLDMISDDSDMNDEEESNFHDTDLEISDDEDDDNSDSMDINDLDAATGSGTDSNGSREWLPSDDDLSHCPFTVQNVGATLQSVPQTELEFLQNFLTDELLMEIVTVTNAYATIRFGKRVFSNNSVWYKWKDVSLPEMKADLGVVLKMALVEKPDVKSYFSREWTEYYPFFLDVFSRRRFLQIHWIMHVRSPQPTVGPITRGSKISNVIKYVQNIGQFYTPAKCCC